MLNPTTLEIDRGALLEAADWGDGYCLSCGELAHGAEDGQFAECPSCGQHLVMSGTDLLRFAKALDRCASPYPDTL